jgi:tetratricopeptide (TPR) repeat protein
MVRSLSYASAAVLAVSVAEEAGAQPIETNVARPGSLLGNASDQGVVGVVLAALLLPTAISSWSRRSTAEARWVPLVGVASAVVTTALSASRGALLALACVGAVHTARFLMTAKITRRAIGVTIGLIVGVATLVVALPETRDRVLGTSPLAAETAEQRWVMWGDALSLIRDHPWLGVGPSGFVDAIPLYFGSTWFAEVGRGRTLDSPHNLVLQISAAAGLVGLAACIIVLLLIARQVVGNYRAALHDDAGRVVATAVTVRGKGTSRSARIAGRDKPTRTHPPNGGPEGFAPPRSELLWGAILALLAYGVALMVHFTSASTTILAALIAGTAVSVPTRDSGVLGDSGSTWLRAESLRAVGILALACWATALTVSAVAELPLRAGVDAASRGDVRAADQAFTMTQGLRPWDADTALIAAESYAGAADRGSTAAAQRAVNWGLRARDALPMSLRAAKAVAVGQQYSGDFEQAATTLTGAAKLAPTDPEVFHRLGAIQAALGRESQAEANLRWAAELDPTQAGVWQSLVSLFLTTGDASGLVFAEAGHAAALAATQDGHQEGGARG